MSSRDDPAARFRPLSPFRDGPLRRLWRRGIGLKFRLSGADRLDGLLLEEVDGIALLVLPGVFHPSLFGSSRLLASAVSAEGLPAGSRALDLGCGTGLAGIAAAAAGLSVVSSDLNPDAVRCACLNVLLNRLEARIDVRGGDLFATVPGERFDLVAFNPPFYDGAPATEADRAFRSVDVPERFAKGLAAHLSAAGRALVATSTTGGEGRTLEALDAAAFDLVAVAEARTPGERLTVWRATARVPA